MTNWHLIKVTSYGFATDTTFGAGPGKLALENPNADDWRDALDKLDERARYDRGPAPVVLAIPTTPHSSSYSDPCQGSIGKVITLTRCAVCEQFKVPRRKHTCDRHFDPRVGDVFHKTHIFWRWIGEGDYGDNMHMDRRDHPHLFREERTTDVMEITAINHEEAWTWEDPESGEVTHYPAENEIVAHSVTHEKDCKPPYARILKTNEADKHSPEGWRVEIGSAHGRERRNHSYGAAWLLVTKGGGASLSDTITQSQEA